MKKHLIVSTLVTTLGLLAHAHAASFAGAVVDYTPGTGVGAFTDPTAALGKPAAETGFGPVTPFNPHFGASQLARIGEGGQLTLQLTNYVLVNNTLGVRELGIWENVGLIDVAAFPDSGTADNPASVFGDDSAIVEVSADNVTWFALNSGAPILFNLPGNYYANSTGAYDPAPSIPVDADFGLPFTGSLSDFNGEDYAQVLATLGGSAGGTWLDIDSSFGLTQVGYVRFSGVAPGQTLEIDGVAINTAQQGAPVPEPGSALLAGIAFALSATRRYRRA